MKYGIPITFFYHLRISMKEFSFQIFPTKMGTYISEEIQERAGCFLPPSTYKTGTEMDIGTETSLAKPESLFAVELPAKAYPTPRPPKCMMAFSHRWNSRARDAAFRLARFVPVNNNV